MAGQASVFMNRKGAIYWLMGLTILFQIISHLKMWSVLRSEEEERSADVDAWCPTSANVTAPRCAEARLFHAWKIAAAAVAAPGAAEVEDMTTTPAPVVAEDQALRAVLGLSVAEAPPQEAPTEAPWSPMTAWAEGLAELQRGLERRFNALPSVSQKRSEEFERHAGRIAVSLEGSQLTHWGEDLRVLQERLEAKQASLHKPGRAEAQKAAADSAEAQKAAADRAALAPAEAAVQPERPAVGEAVALPQEGQPAAEQSLMNRINAVHKELCQDPRRRARADCTEFLAGLAAAREAARDAKRLAEGPAAGAEAALHVDLERVAAEHEAWQRDFEAQIAGAYRELCAQRGGTWCTPPEATSASTEAPAASDRAARRAEIAREAREHTAALDAKLAKLAADRKDWERELLDHYGVAAAVPEPTSAPPSPPRASSPSWPGRLHALRWAPVKAWAQGERRLRGTTAGGRAVEATRADLRGARWAKDPPRVACVTAVPLGHRAKSQVKYIVENFMKQSYEGASQLVLVYHHHDHEAAEVVREYSQPPYIHGVAARGSREDFPSAAALRYGAWSAKGAQVIADWDFDGRQHPRRLEWQVAALALAQKPACLLRPKATEEDVQGGERPEVEEESLVGEISWMREFWHPTSPDQHDILATTQVGNIVTFSMDTPRPQTTAASERLRAIRTDMDRHFDHLAALLAPNATATAAVVPPPAITV